VLGVFFLILGLGVGILFRVSYGDGELGSIKRDQLGAYETFTAAAPLVMRVMTATVDPPMDPARAWDRFKSIAVTVTLPDGLSVAARRLDGDHLAELRSLGGGQYRDEFPSDCFTIRCERTQVLVACDTKPAAAGSMSVFMGAEIVAAPAGTSPSSVDLAATPDRLPSAMAADLAKATGCEGHA
jgi:hypothetical protein